MKKLLVLTTNIGKKDPNSIKLESTKNMDYIEIIDSNTLFKSDVGAYENRRTSRTYKLLAPVLYQDYEYVMWIDGTFNFKINPINILESQLTIDPNFDLKLFLHPNRKCLYDESLEVERLGLDFPEVLHAQRQYYEYNKMPRNFGLAATGCMIWKVNRDTIQFALSWYEQLCRFSSRDQISLSYCMWKYRDILNINWFVNNEKNKYLHHNDLFNIVSHNYIQKNQNPL